MSLDPGPAASFMQGGVRVDVYDSGEAGFWCMVHFKNRRPGTVYYSTVKDATNAAIDMIRGYEAALYDARDNLNRNFQGLLSDMLEIM